MLINWEAAVLLGQRDERLPEFEGMILEKGHLIGGRTIGKMGVDLLTHKTPGSPKQAFSEALQIGLITPDEEMLWIQIMKDRNLASHTYNQALAKDLCEKIAKLHIKLFISTLTRIQKFTAVKG